MCVYRSITIWLSVCVALAQDDPYCSVRYERLCQGKGPHIACQYPYRGAGPECENYTSIIFTNDLKQFILHYINRRRQKIASGHERVRGGVHLPKPEVMMLVQWDRELAHLAQRLADQCQFVHDDCRATVRYPYAGQTVGEVRWRRSGTSLESGARRTIGRVFDAWWGERRRVHAKQLISPFVLTARGAVWGHFSQLAVWTLRAMGCGAVHHGATRPRLLLVCDFSHTNMLGQRTISPGPLAPCPPHTVRMSRPYPLLCGPPPNPVIVDNDGDDENDEEEYYDDKETVGREAETKRPAVPRVSEISFATRPWPDRPVKPIEHETVDTNNEPDRQEQKTIDRPDQSETEDVITQPLRKQSKIGDDPAERISDNVHDQSYRDQDTDQNSGQEHVIMDTDNQDYGQYDRTINLDNHYAKPKDKPSDRDDYVKNRDGHYARVEDRTLDTDTQNIRQRDRKIKTDNQSLKNQHKMVDPNRYVQDRLPKPVQERDRPVQEIRLALHDDLNDEYRPTHDSTEEVTNRPGPIEAVNQPRRMSDFEKIDNVPNRPVKDDVESRARPDVHKEYDKDSERVTRPLPRDEDDDEAWRRTIATNAIVVSVKYRDNPQGLYKKRLDDELNTRNQELDQNRLKPQSRNYNRQDINKPVYQTDDVNSQIRLKGEDKAYGYRTQDFEENPRPTVPYERSQWEENEMKRLEVTAAPLRKQSRPQVTVVVYRPTSLFSVQTEAVFRQRWAQTRVRPRRPGANALMKASNLPHFVLRHSKKASLVLDKDDEEQLYHDTGFKMSSKKHN